MNGTRMIRRDEARIGDVLRSTHYGIRELTDVFTQGETTELRFGECETHDGMRLRNERYDRRATIELMSRPSPDLARDIDTVVDLMQQVRDDLTGGYDAEVSVLPQREAHRAGDGFFLVMDVRSNDPGSRVTGEWWFDDDGRVVQVL